VVFRLMADVVVVVHFAFIVFVAVGGIMAWRWPKLLWAHLATVAWGAGIVTIGWDCPLTPLEKHLRRLGDEQGYEGGFVDRYVEGVIYPERYTTLLRLLVAGLIAVGWLGLYLRHGRRATPA
jgi:Protein of Unknown function (DUF2784)